MVSSKPFCFRHGIVRPCLFKYLVCLECDFINKCVNSEKDECVEYKKEVKLKSIDDIIEHLEYRSSQLENREPTFGSRIEMDSIACIRCEAEGMRYAVKLLKDYIGGK